MLHSYSKSTQIFSVIQDNLVASQKWGAERAALVYKQQQEVIALQQEYYGLYNSLPEEFKKEPHTVPAPVAANQQPKMDILQLQDDIKRLASKVSVGPLK